MAEKRRLYMKKNVFNGRYFVRNIQIVICLLIAIVITVGTLMAFHGGKKGTNLVENDAKANAKKALFGSTVERKEDSSQKEHQTDTEAAKTQEQTTEHNQSDDDSKEVIESTTEQVKKSEFDGKCIAKVDETLNIRKEPSRDAEFVGSMSQGAIAIVEGNDGEWTKIKSGDVEGYVLTDYVLTGESAEEFAKDYVTIQGTAKEDGVNVREDRSTDADILTVLNKNDIISVVEVPEEHEDKAEDVKKASEQETTDEAGESVDGTQDSNEENGNVTGDKDTSVDLETGTKDTTGAADDKDTTGDLETEAKDSENKATDAESAAGAENTTENNTDDTQGVTWLTVMLDSGQIGYVSDDYVKVDRLYVVAVSAEELERQAEEKAAAERAAAEAAMLAAKEAAEAAERAAAEATRVTNVASNSSNSGTTGSNTSSSYQGESTTPVTATSSGESLGTFTITAYCGCDKCCKGNNRTASGTTPTQGRTIAADTSILPFGTQVVIDGVVYTVEDRGSAVTGKHIDIFFATHEQAMAYGTRSVTVYKN